MPKSGPVLGDNQLLEGQFPFVGAAVTRMPRTRVPAYRCGTDWSSWLDGAHPTVEDDEVRRKVCLNNRPTGCKYPTQISFGCYTNKAGKTTAGWSLSQPHNKPVK